MKQIYDKCSEWGLKLTGHLILEENLLVQLTANGACMPHYEYMHIPGMDWLGRDIFDCLTPMQVSSVCDQLGIKQVLSETFALCGHNVSFAELKGMYEWQMVHGINLLCQHLEGYSIRGIRKRDYPPAMYCQQPWWSEYKGFVDAMSREGMVLTESKKFADVLVVHPQTTAWSLYDGKPAEDSKYDEIEKVNNELLLIMKTLEHKHIMYHLGDETIMERHAKVENGKLVIGEQSYSYIIDSACEILLPKTNELLEEFRTQGGKIITADELLENPVLEIDRKGINAIRVKIGDKEKVMLTDDRLQLEDFGVRGKTKIEITLINNLRNNLGPHHLEIGESYRVCPSSFFKEECVWTPDPEKWNDGYCFVEMSV